MIDCTPLPFISAYQLLACQLLLSTVSVLFIPLNSAALKARVLRYPLSSSHEEFLFRDCYCREKHVKYNDTDDKQLKKMKNLEVRESKNKIVDLNKSIYHIHHCHSDRPVAIVSC